MRGLLAEAFAGVSLTQGRYAVGLDHADFEMAGSAFLDDATFQTPAGAIWNGREDIVTRFRSGYEARKAANQTGIFQRHHVTTRHLEVTEDATVVVDSYFFVTTENGLDFSGTYKDVFSKVPGDWLIKSRVITCDWIHPNSRFASPELKVRARGDFEGK